MRLVAARDQTLSSTRLSSSWRPAAASSPSALGWLISKPCRAFKPRRNPARRDPGGAPSLLSSRLTQQDGRPEKGYGRWRFIEANGGSWLGILCRVSLRSGGTAYRN